jgi:hypothetical protein
MEKQKREWHGLRKTTEYNIWNGMKQRCYNPNDVSYFRYGGVGVTVCDKWKDSFLAFYEDMGPRPTKHHSIDRKDNSLGYSPDNCRWATATEQANNTKSNFRITIDGESKTVAEWSSRSSVPSYVIRARIHNHGWPHKKAVFAPVGKKLIYKGREETLMTWCRLLSLDYDKVQQRIKKLGWPTERAFEAK